MMLRSSSRTGAHYPPSPPKNMNRADYRVPKILFVLPLVLCLLAFFWFPSQQSYALSWFVIDYGPYLLVPFGPVFNLLYYPNSPSFNMFLLIVSGGFWVWEVVAVGIIFLLWKFKIKNKSTLIKAWGVLAALPLVLHVVFYLLIFCFAAFVGMNGLSFFS
jgi:hypothetical protein